MHVLVGWLKLRSVLFGWIGDGMPIVVLDEGRWSSGAMRWLRMRETDIRTAMRYAIIERDGTISIILKAKR